MSTHSRPSRALHHLRGVRALLLVVLSCGALLGVGAVPASAAVIHEFEFSFNGSDVTDTPTGPFSDPGANAFDRTGTAVYVLDIGRSVVDKFNAAGTYAGVQITGASTPAGSFSFGATSGVAVDNSGLGTDASNRDVYVANTNDDVVDKFTASGTFVCQIAGEGSASTDPTHECSTSQAGVGSITPTGLAVDSSGNLFVADSAHDVVDEFDSAGNYTGHQIPDSHITNPATIALDSSGNLYVTNFFSNVVEFDAAGTFVRTLDSNSSPFSVAVDPATAHVYVAEYASQTPIAEYDPSGNLVDTFGNGISVGLAVRGSSGEVYVDALYEGVVDVFGPDVVIPDVTATAATELKQFTATLNGEVGPAGGGNVKGCQFEYVTRAHFEAEGFETAEEAPCSPATPYASVTNVSASLSALSPETTYHFRVAASNSNGVVSYSSDQTLTTPALAVTGQATHVTGKSATLNGTVDPDGATITDCHFEYGPTTRYGQSQSCASTPSGSSPVAVSADITGLAENTTYHFRLVADYSDGSNAGSDAGSDETFTTLTSPLIDAAYTTNLTESSVDLNAEINPKGFDTTYHFEWGTSTSYGNSVPVPDADIGSGASDVPVSQHLEGLSANTVYHWRVVATNSIGATEGQDHTFVYQTTTPAGVGCPNEQLRTENALSLSLPDCRAYEQVSPVDKNNSDVANAFAGSDNQQASVDGDRFFYDSVGAFPGAPSSVIASLQYLASRGASGWSTRAVGLPLTASHVPPGGGVDYSLPLSPDLSTGVLRQAEPALAAGAPGPGIWNLYVGQLAAGSYQLVTNTTPPNQIGIGFDALFQGASTDFSHVIFGANDALTPEAPYPAYNLYEWVEGHLRLVGLIPTSGTSCTGAECIPADGSQAGGRAVTGAGTPVFAHAISADGSRIVFSADEGFEHIYDRLNGTTTVDVSASQRTPSAGSASAHYQDASVDGSHVLFTSEGALTNDAVPGSGENLYDYDVETGRLSDLTAANEVEFQGLAGISEDVSHVYFVADGVLAANSNSHSDTAIAGKPNLYLWHGGQTTFIATLGGEDFHDWAEPEEPATRVTPDGAQFAFDSVASLTGYDNTDANTGNPDTEVFLYDAAANRLICASCDPSGARPIGPSELHWAESVVYVPRNLSADGSRLFFTSRDALLPGATNGLWNVYEWEADGSGGCQSSADNSGCLYLISDGSGASNSYFADASESGNDVFFETGASLVGQDEDSFADLYDARVDGGFASQDKPVVPPACTSVEGCLSPLSEPPAQLGVASAELHGSGNLVTPPEAPTTAVKKTAAQIRAEKLTKALKACKKEPRKKRAKCQKQANKSFGKAK